MANVKRLPELSERDAPTEIKAIYDEIRACCRVPLVALIYRHLATQNGVLEWGWRALAPVMRSGVLSDAAEKLASVPLAAELPLLTREKALALALKPMDRAAISYIVAAYNTANPHNIIAVRVLMLLLASEEAGGQCSGDSGKPTPLAKFPGMPSLVELEEMPPALAELIPRLRIGSDNGSRKIVPTLYRHLAHWPDYMMDQANALIPLFQGGEIEEAATRIAAIADSNALRLGKELTINDLPGGRPTGATREQLLVTLADFAATIPEMIAVGRLMAAALPRN